VNALIEQVRTGRRRAIAQLITQIENNDAAARSAIKALYSDTGKAHIIGVTGPPGTGKSTLVNEIAKVIRKSDLRVGIIAVDPSSPFTGGALLGDRVRMRDLSGDAGIFIRSMASRGSLGGLARMTGNVVKLLDAAGYEVILVETVGAGQAEVDIASTAHTTMVIEAPGMGDEIQTIKAGILEIADLLVVNKADRPGSDRTVKALKAMLQMGQSRWHVDHHGKKISVEMSEKDRSDSSEHWQVPVLDTVATDGKGIEELVEVTFSHKTYLQKSGQWLQREKARCRQEIGQLLQTRYLTEIQARVPMAEREKLIVAVAERRIDPYSAVDVLFAQTNYRD
jgi:LAO/AO transport system kinase